MEYRLETKESFPTIETVRAALFYRGNFLTLQKSADSKNPDAIEFPGGKIDEIKGSSPTLEEQKRALILEVQQETGIEIDNLPIEKIDNFEYYFETIDKAGIKKKNKRNVHLFLVRIPDSNNVVLKINETLNSEGQSEDKHKDFNWVTPSELVDSATKLKKNLETKEVVYQLTKNSRHIKKILTAVGYLK